MEEIRQSSYLERWLKYKEQIVEGLAKAPGALIALLEPRAINVQRIRPGGNSSSTLAV
jgi:hypothetical protein